MALRASAPNAPQPERPSPNKRHSKTNKIEVLHQQNLDNTP